MPAYPAMKAVCKDRFFMLALPRITITSTTTRPSATKMENPMNDLRNDFNSLLGQSNLSGNADRRTFLKTALGTGFAAAVLPVCAQTMIKTDTQGLTAGEVSIEVNGQRVPAYRAQPEGKTGLPVIIVVSEIFGVHEHIADIARRFAKLGYLAIAPDFFVRQGNPMAYTSIAELQKEIISKVPDAQVMGDIDAYVKWAGENGGDISAWASTASAGAAASSGSTAPTIPRSRPGPPGMAAWWATRPRCSRSSPSISRRR
jgi:carboxymethylenebutenolidase